MSVANLSEKVQTANIFTAEQDQQVRSLSINTATPFTSVTFEVYLLDSNATNPTDGTLAANTQKTFEYGGFHRAQLPESVKMKAGQRYSVVVTQHAPSGDYQLLVPASLGKEGSEYLRDTVDDSIDWFTVGIVNEGESMLYDGGVWTDWVDSIAGLRQVQHKAYEQEKETNPDVVDTCTWIAYDNFPIKAYADAWDSSEDAESSNPMAEPTPEPGTGTSQSAAQATNNSSGNQPTSAGDSKGMLAMGAAGVLVKILSITGESSSFQ